MKKILCICIIASLVFIINCSKESYPPPRMRIEFPKEYPYNLVGNNVILTFILSAQFVTWIKVVSSYGENLMYQRLNRDLYDNEELWIEMNYFGVPGKKRIKLIAGNEWEEVAIDEIEIINDDKLLEQEAIKYLNSFSVPYWPPPGRFGLMMNRRIYVYTDVEGWDEYIDKAIGYWKQWGGGFLDYERVNEIKLGTIYIKKEGAGAFCMDFKVRPLCKECQVFVSKDMDKEYNDYRKTAYLVHEMGHCHGIEGFSGSYYPPTPWGAPSIMSNMDFILFNPFEQKALQLIYSTDPPGSLFY